MTTARDDDRDLHELTRELQELRGRQEAVVDVLRALSGSGMRLQPILDQIVETAAGSAGPIRASSTSADGELLRMQANFGQPQEVVEYEREHPDRPGPNSCTGRVAMTREPVHIPDVSRRSRLQPPVRARSTPSGRCSGCPCCSTASCSA